jgi:predicted RNase H-like nuclease
MRYNAQGGVRDFLARTLEDAIVRVNVPNPMPQKFVLVRQEGGRRLDAHRSSAGIGVFVWAATEAEAYDLALRVSEAMRLLAYTAGVADVIEEEFGSSPDPEDKKPRWYGSYTLTTYEI